MKKNLLVVFYLLMSPVATAQRPFSLNDAAGIVKGLAGGSSPFTNWIRNEPISTSFRDAEKEYVLPDEFGNDRLPMAIHRQLRTPNGGYWLGPGFYELRARSFCIKAGTHAPSAGDAYLYAPLAGRQADIVSHILQQMEHRPGIDQHQVQYLLWALIARADFRQMNPAVKATAVSLMKAAHLARINKRAIVGTAMSLTNTSIPREFYAIFEAEARMRQVFLRAGASLQQLESLAMLAGAAAVDNPDYRRGRWAKHPDGYFVRYFPSGYSRTIVQVYVPDELERVEFDATNDVATPANTGAQRLALSNMPYDTTGPFARQAPVIIAQAPVPPTPAPKPQVEPTPEPTPTPTPPIRATPVYQDVCVTVQDEKTKKRIAGALALVNESNYTTNEQGEFGLKKMAIAQTVRVTVSAAGYVEQRVRFETISQAECQRIDIELTPIPPQPIAPAPVDLNSPTVKAGDRIILQAIQFEQSKSRLLPEGDAELDRLSDWMKRNPGAQILLEGHTSNEGKHDANVSLSLDRVAACKQYLVKKGIKKDRIRTIGYGPDRPLVENDTPDNRARNRRVELFIEKM